MVLGLVGLDLDQLFEMHERLLEVLLVNAPSLLGRIPAMDPTHESPDLRVVWMFGQDSVGHGHRFRHPPGTGEQVNHLDPDDHRPGVRFQSGRVFLDSPVHVLRAHELLREVVVKMADREPVIGFAPQFGGQFGGREAGRESNPGQKQSADSTTDALPGRTAEPCQ